MQRTTNMRSLQMVLARRAVTAGLLGVCIALLSTRAVNAQEEPADPKDIDVVVPEGRLYNITDQPVTFQLHQRDGAAWTASYTIPAGKYYSIRAPKGTEESDIQGLTGNGRGFVIIRFPEPALGGNMTVRLPARNPETNVLQPTWYAVKDSNGIIRMVQEPSMEQAKKVQDSLQKQPRMSPQELEKVKHMLRANWVLTN